MDDSTLKALSKNRTAEQQELIDRMLAVFPESGYPKQILLLDDLIAIPSYLQYIGIGYKHPDFVPENGRPAHRLCIYTRSDIKLRYKFDFAYAVNSVLPIDKQMLIATGVRGQPAGGGLYVLDLLTGSLRSCMKESHAVSILQISEGRVEAVVHIQTGPYDGENYLFRLEEGLEFELDAQRENAIRQLSDEELDSMLAGMSTAHLLSKMIELDSQ